MVDLMEDEVFVAFAKYATIVLLKMLLLGPLTGFYRFSRGSFISEEDVSVRARTPEEKKRLLSLHPDVERVRRCHQNDLENIIPFVLIGLLYSLTGPELSTALLHFRLFAGSRIVHTIVYVGAVPQPCRLLAFTLGLGVTLSMAYRILSTILVL